ncbi:MAG TPA: hypothetical protein VMH40_03735 [Myxococcaceae bacterium]|nr:hypothetical protein [Myxococcaceae bacterium]
MKRTLEVHDHDFSLVLGGPLYQLFQRAHLSGPALEQLARRIWVITLVAWLPLLVLCIATGRAVGPPSALPFLRDIETQVRLLVALPLLIAAELVVHGRTRSVVAEFLARGIVRPADLPRFDANIASAMRLRNSIPLEVLLLVLVATVGHWVWRSTIAFGASSWYATPVDGHMELTSAGIWYAVFALPVTQFMLLRWYFRLLIWFRFLWKTSRMELHLVPTHPDRAAGLSFLGKSTYAFGPLLFAQGALLAGIIATRVLYGGQSLLSFKMDVVGLIGFFVLFLLGPLMVFTPLLSQAKRTGLAAYGKLASEYVTAFEQKWLQSARGEEQLLGTADIQSLSDLGQSYSIIREMNLVPFGLQDISRLALATAVPLLPLTLTIFSLEELVTRLLKIVF